MSDEIGTEPWLIGTLLESRSGSIQWQYEVRGYIDGMVVVRSRGEYEDDGICDDGPSPWGWSVLSPGLLKSLIEGEGADG